MDGNHNRTNGTRFEAAFARKLAEHGWWVHRMQQGAGGQPADLIAVRGMVSLLIDCKVITTVKGFPFSRIEPNQRDSMDAFTRASGENSCWFALKLPNGKIRMLAYDDVKFMESDLDMKSVTMDAMRYHTQDLAEWLEGGKEE